MSEEQAQQETQQPTIPNLKDVLSKTDSYPGDDQIEKWKEQFGEVFCSGFSEEDIFVWRPVTRLEWSLLQRKLGEAQQEQSSDFDLESELVVLCTLWQSNHQSLVSKAGTVTTLSEMIMNNSNFVAPQVSHMLVQKL